MKYIVQVKEIDTDKVLKQSEPKSDLRQAEHLERGYRLCISEKYYTEILEIQEA